MDEAACKALGNALCLIVSSLGIRVNWKLTDICKDQGSTFNNLSLQWDTGVQGLLVPETIPEAYLNLLSGLDLNATFLGSLPWMPKVLTLPPPTIPTSASYFTSFPFLFSIYHTAAMLQFTYCCPLASLP